MSPSLANSSPFFGFKSYVDPNCGLQDKDEATSSLIEDFNRSLTDGNCLQESTECLCSAAKDRLLAHVDRNGFMQNTVVCQACGLIRSNPRLTSEEYAKFYQSDTYRRVYDGSGFMDFCTRRYSTQTGQHILDEVVNSTGDVRGKSIKSMGRKIGLLD